MSEPESAIVQTRLSDHPAVRAWHKLEGDRARPHAIQVLKEDRHDVRCDLYEVPPQGTGRSAVYRLLGVGPAGESVVAKQGESGATERVIYETVLPHLPISTLRYYGSVADNDTASYWLFMEDGGDENYSPETPEHRAIAGQWLGAMNQAARRLTACLTVAAMLYVTFRMDWRLALVALGITPALYLLSNRYRRRMRERSREVRRLESSALSVVQEALSALRVVKAFGKEDHEEERFVRRYREGVRARIRLSFLEGGYDLMVGLTTALGTGAVLWIGVQHVQQGKLTLGGLLLVMSYLAQLYTPLRTIGKKASSLQAHLAGAERAFSVLDRLPDVSEAAQRAPADTRCRCRGVP
jgi:ABC-type multidrug transport system fused ATPase/permease subunit